MPHFAASDLGLHCLPITLLGVKTDDSLRENSKDPDKHVDQSSMWISPGSLLFTKLICQGSAVASTCI